MEVCISFPVLFGVRAAITDAYQKKSNLAGSTLYTTLFPSNTCAQMIKEAEIAEVVYIEDKFHHADFMVASRRILEGVKCR